MMTVAVRRVLTAAVAGVWLHQGLWCKVMRKRPEHEAIVAGAPLVGAAGARAATVAIGALEAGLAAWVLSGRARVQAAVAQTALLAGMNAGGLVFARQQVPASGRMLLRNAGFVALIWALPALGRRG